MEKLTEAELKEFAPKARREYVDALINGWNDLQRAEINTTLRLCEFLAQTAHETGGFTILRENTKWSGKRMCEIWPGRFKFAADPRIIACRGDDQALANLAYGSGDLAKTLGNVEADDGWRYRGGSFLQGTGRAFYREAGAALGLDLEERPELIENSAIGLRVALWTWGRAGCNKLADRHYTRAIGNAINRGSAYTAKEPIGHKDRLMWFDRAWAIFGDGPAPKTLEGMALGAHGANVEAVQVRLRELGYGVGNVDKTFGPSLSRAVVGFKADQKRAGIDGLEADEIVGVKTLAALDTAGKAPVAPERETATEHDLVAAGSHEVAAGRQSKTAGWLMVGGGAAEGARQSGGLDMIQKQVGWVPEMQTVMVPVIEAVKWGLSNAFWVVVIGGGVWFWAKGREVIAARLKAHRLGFNLFR